MDEGPACIPAKWLCLSFSVFFPVSTGELFFTYVY